MLIFDDGGKAKLWVPFLTASSFNIYQPDVLCQSQIAHLLHDCGLLSNGETKWIPLSRKWADGQWSQWRTTPLRKCGRAWAHIIIGLIAPKMRWGGDHDGRGRACLKVYLFTASIAVRTVHLVYSETFGNPFVHTAVCVSTVKLGGCTVVVHARVIHH